MAKSVEVMRKHEQEEREKQEKVEQERREKEKPPPPVAPPPTQPPPPVTQPSPTPATKDPARAIYGETPQSLAWRDKIQWIREQVLPAVSSNPQLRQYCYDAKRTITPKIGQLTNKRQTIQRVTHEIDTILVKTRNVSPQAYMWLLNHTSKATVKQSEAEVTVKPESAYPLARVCVELAHKHPDFMEILLARMYKNCPFILPIYLQKYTGQSMDNHLKQVGYIKPDGEAWENETAYTERMNGIVALYAAILQTPNGPLAFTQVWTWLSRVLNAPPRVETPSLINTFLEVIGNRLLTEYGKQAIKLLQFIKQDYLQRMPARAIGATTRLDNYLTRCMANQQLEQLQGSQWTE